MSLRSQRSAHSRHNNSNTATATTGICDDAAIYTSTLRVAILQHVIASKPAQATATTTSTTSTNTYNSSNAASNVQPPATGKRESLRRTLTEAAGAGWSNSFTGLSWGDLFRGDNRNLNSSTSGSTSSPKYPEKFIKVLKQRLENISRGTDREYQEMLLRYTIGAFYGKFQDPKNSRTIRENRKLEDLLMMFIATATEVLKKRCTGDEWKMKLEEQVEVFAKICEDGLRNKEVKHVPPELLTKLETIKERIIGNRKQITDHQKPLPPPSSGQTSSARPSIDYGTTTSTPTVPLSSASTTTSFASAPSFNLQEMPLARQVGVIFNVDPIQVQRDIHAMKKQCTERVRHAVSVRGTQEADPMMSFCRRLWQISNNA